MFTDLAYGVTDRIEFGVQIPFYSLEFRNLSNPNRPKTTKIGDIRLYARYRFLAQPVVVTVRGGVKTPTGGTNVDAEVVPVGEGQWDVEWFLDVGRSLSIFPGYANLGLGYRLRTTNSDFAHRPADEFSLLAESGWQITPFLMGKGAVSYLISGHPESLGFTLTRERRELLAVTPGLSYLLDGVLTFEAGVNIPVTGQDLPAGPQLNVGVSYTFDLFRFRNR